MQMVFWHFLYDKKFLISLKSTEFYFILILCFVKTFAEVLRNVEDDLKMLAISSDEYPSPPSPL